MNLFIAEKPSMAREIAKGLSGKTARQNGYIVAGDNIVTWAYGHLMQLCDPGEYDEKWVQWAAGDLPIIPKEWKLKISNNCNEQFAIIKKLINKASIIINAGDPDREGQLLIDEILDYVGNKKPVKRLLLNALDEKSVKRALSNLRNNDDFNGLKNSALARQRADWLIGMNLSRAYTLAGRKSGDDKVYAIGRVMTPTLAIVTRRENEIKNFKPVQYYTLKAEFEGLTAVWLPKEEQKGLDSEGRITDPSVIPFLIAKLLDGNKIGTITNYESKEIKTGQKSPYSLSALQIDAGNIFGYDPQQVLDAAQSLYEKKFTTYPRSDCEYLPENQFPEAEDIFVRLKICGNTELALFADGADTNIKSKAWNDKKITAHHAIIPTTSFGHLDKLEDTEKNIFYLIAKAYIAQFYPVHIYSTSKIHIEYLDENFEAVGKVINQLGWKELYKSNNKEVNLPVVSIGEKINYLRGEMEEKMTQPPKRFTSSSLVEAMKKIYKYVQDESLKSVLKASSGMGTEATRAGIIDKLLKTGYLKLEKKMVVPTKKAYALYDVLPDELSYPDTTAVWEQELAKIAEGKAILEDFISNQEVLLNSLISKALQAKFACPDNIILCPNCGQALKKRMNKEKKTYFWACSGYPDCKTTFPDNKGKPELPKYKCPECGKWLRKLKGKNGVFWACSGYPDCKTTFPDIKGKPKI